MRKFPDSRNYKADLNSFLKNIGNKEVRPLIKNVSDTHFSRVDVILSAQNGSGEPENWVYEVFSNFSSDTKGKERSLHQAQQDLEKLEKELRKDGVNLLDRGSITAVG